MGEIPTRDWSWIDEEAMRFEQAWKAGRRPRIEDVLARRDESQRPVLLKELIGVERELRRAGGERPTADEYRRRFPSHAAVVDSVFETMKAVGDGPGSGGRAREAPAIPPELAGLHDYEILRPLGGGGMGLVFLAHNHLLGRDEVVKVISREIIEIPGVLERFLREIRAVAGLQHPNIVTAYAAYPSAGGLVFAMEYVEGLDLARMVRAAGPLPVDRACHYIHQAALGLQHAHEKGLVHRDIKPGNLMSSFEGRRPLIKVLDFGLAKAGREQAMIEPFALAAGDSGTKNQETRPGQMLGTPDFIAPEQITNAQSADIRADIYSLGCTLYFLLRGRAPFQGADFFAVLQSHLTETATPLNLLRPEVPTELAALVARMMAKDPGRRFWTPAEVSQALTPYFPTRGAGGKPARLPSVAAAAYQTTLPDPDASAVEGAGMPESTVSIATDAGGDDDTGRVSAAASPARHRPRWLWPVAASTVGVAAVGLIVYLLAFRTGGNPSRMPPEKNPSLFPGLPAPEEKASRRAKTDPPVPASSPGDEDRPPKPPETTTPPKLESVATSTPAPAPPPPSAPPKDVEKPGTPAPEPKPKAVAGREEKPPEVTPVRRLSPLGEKVEPAIRAGVDFLKRQQREDGSWPDVHGDARSGTTSLVTLALLAAGEKIDSPAVRNALAMLRKLGPDDLRSTYAIALQTMVFAAAGTEQDRMRIVQNVDWLQRAQIEPSDPVQWPGSWTYTDFKRGRRGDNSNTHYALLGLHAAAEVGIAVRPEVWALARYYWEGDQQADGGWTYTPERPARSASMTCAGISALAITRYHMRSQETFKKASVSNCGDGRADGSLQLGIDWLARHFDVRQNVPFDQFWKFYYLHDLEQAGQITGHRFFNRDDWYRQGAEELVGSQNRLAGFWRGALMENEIIATSFAILFLANGRSPVLINKLIHWTRPIGDWNNDPDDIRNLVATVSRDWRSPLTWQVADSRTATVDDLLQAPILFVNGHWAPDLGAGAKKVLREYVDRGGVILAEACCGKRAFDKGFRTMIGELFPSREERLRPLPKDHLIWRARHLISPGEHPLLGVERGGRTVIIYSPTDLSCYWNQAHRQPKHPAVIEALRVGQNLVDYITGRKLPPDKLSLR